MGTLTIADPQNWVALGAFLVTSIMGSQLSARIRREADEANSRRREIERLYKFSQKLLGEGNVIQLMNAIPNYVVESFEAGAAELFLPQKEKFYRSGFGASHLDEEKMKTAFLRDEMTIEPQQSVYFVPVRLGVRAIGSLGISGARLSRQTLDAVGSSGGDRDRTRASRRTTQPDGGRAARRTLEVRSAGFHHARFPHAADLHESGGYQHSRRGCEQITPQSHELLSIINEECDRLNHLVEEAAEMARLEAGEIELRICAHSHRRRLFREPWRYPRLRWEPAKFR